MEYCRNIQYFHFEIIELSSVSHSDTPTNFGKKSDLPTNHFPMFHSRQC